MSTLTISLQPSVHQAVGRLAALAGMTPERYAAEAVESQVRGDLDTPVDTVIGHKLREDVRAAIGTN